MLHETYNSAKNVKIDALMHVLHSIAVITF